MNFVQNKCFFFCVYSEGVREKKKELLLNVKEENVTHFYDDFTSRDKKSGHNSDFLARKLQFA